MTTKNKIGFLINNSGKRPSTVLKSWEKYPLHIVKAEGDKVGLRTPQFGAYSAVAAHWSVSNAPATISMPTGTGKTDTMIAIMLGHCCSKLLIVVPSDALRSQIANAFSTLGILKELLLINNHVNEPVVGVINSRPSNAKELLAFSMNCNVIVATQQVLNSIDSTIMAEFSSIISHVFFDEAHHLPAKKWYELKDRFKKCHILQFTATPFRNDKKRIEGKLIYNFPLKKAQEEGYFKPVTRVDVKELDEDKHDIAIAKKSLEVLKHDRDRGNPHIMMVRVSNIKRTIVVKDIYEQIIEEESFGFTIATVNSKTPNKAAIVEGISNCQYDIVICVDMLGEGFDLPNFKVCAYHDVKQSLPITLQFIGRFTRESRRLNLGEASIIMNIADSRFTKEVKELFMLDADWNTLLHRLSSDQIEDELVAQDLSEIFKDIDGKIDVGSIKPSFSVVAYKIEGESRNTSLKKISEGIKEWNSAQYKKILPEKNRIENTVIAIIGEQVGNKWLKQCEFDSVKYTLYIVYYDTVHNILYINSSGNSGVYEKIADAVLDNEHHIINGQNVFRACTGIKMLSINNMGVKDRINRQRSFTMMTGQDVKEAISKSENRNGQKCNFFCSGYRENEKIALGCSTKGRIWAHKSGGINEFTTWATGLSRYLKDDNAEIDKIFQDASKVTVLTSYDEIYDKVLYVDWDDDIEDLFKTKTRIILPGGQEISQVDCELVYAGVQDASLLFKVVWDQQEVDCVVKAKIDENKQVVYTCNINLDFVRKGRVMSVNQYFREYSPYIICKDFDSVIGSNKYEYTYEDITFDSDSILTEQWENVNIRHESAGFGDNMRTDSIQYYMLQKLANGQFYGKEYDLLINDDGAGEVADIVAFKINDNSIEMSLFHLKFSHEDNPGARIGDLYEVCGQAAKSFAWANPKAKVHVISQLKNRCAKNPNRIIKGNVDTILKVRNIIQSNYRLIIDVFIVQPGVSKSRISSDQCALLESTERFLKTTFGLKLTVIGSE